MPRPRKWTTEERKEMKKLYARRRRASKNPKKAKDDKPELTKEKADQRLPDIPRFFELIACGVISSEASDGGTDSIRTHVRQTMLADPYYWFSWDLEKDRAYTKALVSAKGDREAKMKWLAENWPARHEYELIVEESQGGI